MVKDKEQQQPESLSLTDWYTRAQAVERIQKNSRRIIDPDTPRKLAGMGKIRRHKLSERMVLYFKEDIDNYIVEAPGMKAARSKQAQAKANRQRKSSK